MRSGPLNSRLLQQLGNDTGYYNQEADFFDCTRGLADGETVAVGPHAFEVIYTPGHAADGIVLYNRENRLLL